MVDNVCMGSLPVVLFAQRGNLFEEYVSVEGRPPFLNIQEKGGLGNWEKTANQTCADVVIKEHLITDWPGM